MPSPTDPLTRAEILYVQATAMMEAAQKMYLDIAARLKRIEEELAKLNQGEEWKG